MCCLMQQGGSSGAGFGLGATGVAAHHRPAQIRGTTASPTTPTRTTTGPGLRESKDSTAVSSRAAARQGCAVHVTQCTTSVALHVMTECMPCQWLCMMSSSQCAFCGQQHMASRCQHCLLLVINQAVLAQARTASRSAHLNPYTLNPLHGTGLVGGALSQQAQHSTDHGWRRSRPVATQPQ